MKRIEYNGLQLWQFENLNKIAAIKHFVTERNTLESGEPFTLSYSSTPDKALVKHNRNLLASAFGIAESSLFMPSQVHKTRILHVTLDTPKTELADTDALITSHPNICIAVMGADCVPILLADTRNKVVAAIHSGWRGTVSKILEKTLQEMRDVYGTHGSDIIAAIGPSVSQESYEVGGEVVEAFNDAFADAASLMIPVQGNKAKLDLWKANTLQLLDFGVEQQRIEISSLCTVIHNHHFFSARRGDSGRFAAGIMLT